MQETYAALSRTSSYFSLCERFVHMHLDGGMSLRECHDSIFSFTLIGKGGIFFEKKAKLVDFI
jgi:hypothetical protein